MLPKILAVLSAVIGVATFYHLNTALSAYFDPLLQTCSKQPPGAGDAPQPPYFKTRIPPVDTLHCLLTPFFVDTVKVPTGRLVTAETFAVFIGIMGIAAVESVRRTARGFVWSWGATALLGQLLGISVAFPLLWLPSFLLFTRPRLHAAAGGGRASSSGSPAAPAAGKVYGIAAAFALLLLPATLVLLQLHKLPTEVQNVALAVFQWGVPLSAAVWAHAPAAAAPARPSGPAAASGAPSRQGRHVQGPTQQQQQANDAVAAGHQAAILLLAALGGMALLMHYAAIVEWWVEGGSLAELQGVVLRSQTSYMPAHFLLVDAGVMTLACLLFVLAEGGAGAAGTFLLRSLLLGPGAAVAAFGCSREAAMQAASGADAAVAAQEAGKRD